MEKRELFNGTWAAITTTADPLFVYAPIKATQTMDRMVLYLRYLTG